MSLEFSTLLVLLGLLFFLIYWILGGVFFALVTVLRLGRVRKVRFSCLFTLLSLVAAVGAAWTGLTFSESAVAGCLDEAGSKAEVITSLFGCGFAGIFGMFIAWFALLIGGGFFLMLISKSKSRPWIRFDIDEEDATKPVSDEGFFE